MITAILMIWIGLKLNAPAWFYVLCVVSAIIKMLSYGIDMYKKGQKDIFDM